MFCDTKLTASISTAGFFCLGSLMSQIVQNTVPAFAIHRISYKMKRAYVGRDLRPTGQEKTAYFLPFLETFLFSMGWPSSGMEKASPFFNGACSIRVTGSRSQRKSRMVAGTVSPSKRKGLETLHSTKAACLKSLACSSGLFWRAKFC